MTRPPRLLDSSSNDALRSLLSSGLDDAPDAQALPKVAAALGLSAVTVAATSLAVSGVGAHAVSAKLAALAGSAPATVAGSTTVSAGTALSASATASASAGAAGFWGGSTALALGKTLLVSMVSAGALSVGAVAVYEHTNPTGAHTAVAERSGGVERAGEAAPGTRPASGTEQRATHARAEQAPTPAPAAVAAEPRATVSEGSDRLAAQAAGAPLQRGSTVARQSPRIEARPENVSQAAPLGTDATRAGALGREVRQIDSARQALESRDADGALAALDSYERSRVVGVLDREALLLKIEALTQKQDLEQAKTLARQYLQRFPTDAHAPRLRALLGASQGVGSTASSVQTFPSVLSP